MVDSLSMDADKLADFLLKNYGQRNQFPQDEKQLLAILFLADQCKQQLEQERDELKREQASLIAMKHKIERKTKK